jgi:hypothetical protein
MSTFTFTAPRAGWYRFAAGAEPEYLGDGPGEEIASAVEVVTFLDEGETRGFANSGSIQTVPDGDWITIPWDHR